MVPENLPQGPLIKVFFTKMDFGAPESSWSRYYRDLSASQAAAMRRFWHVEDRLRYLAGKLLVRKILAAFGLDPELGKRVLKTEPGRPYLEMDFDFNLSHSGDYVLCAGSVESRVGVDVEACKKVDLGDFQQVMSEGQWKAIYAAADPMAEFFRMWALKESVVKADGRGIVLDLDKMEEREGEVRLEGRPWYVRRLEIGEGHPAYLATEQPTEQVSLEELRF